jgi:hypothetical protein
MTMALATEALALVETVIYPDEAESSVNFNKAIQFRWPEVNPSPFILCVGTADGEWNILSGQIGERRQQLFDFSDLPNEVQAVFVQLISGDDGNVGPVIKINRQ